VTKDSVEVGTMFGYLTITKPPYRNEGKTIVDVRCVCGVEYSVNWHNVKRGKSTMCRKCSGIKTRKDLSGKRFGRLIVLNETKDVIEGNNKCSYVYWKVRCDCGNEKFIRGNLLSYGSVVSCGCYNKEKAIIHGQRVDNTYTSVFSTWNSMMARCYNSNSKSYKYYGGKGIKVCDRWHDIRHFMFDMKDRPEGMQLDRIDGGGDYCLENCRWVNLKTQSSNRSNVKHYEVFGTFIMNLYELSSFLCVSASTLDSRRRKGWEIHKVFGLELNDIEEVA
jgi:hypothetical protein